MLPEGEQMLKVTHKKVKPRTFKLDPDRGQILWESKKNNRVNLESIREVRFGPSAAHLIALPSTFLRHTSLAG